LNYPRFKKILNKVL